jgi:outer membrane protein assembly factor BamE (lipoprotein component of BamABCDE complex)
VSHSASRLLLLLALLAACASGGTPIDADSVTKIRPGASTQEDVRRWFGAPTAIRHTGSGKQTWRYEHVQHTRRDTGTITKIGRSITSILGARMIWPPVDVAYEETVRDELEVFFDPDGRVLDYSYEHSKVPSKRVY